MNRIIKLGGWMAAWAGAVLLSAPMARAQNHTSYRIEKTERLLKNDPRTSANEIWVQDERAWKPGVAQLIVTASTIRDVEAPGAYLRVYFFDADNQLVEKRDQANDLHIWNTSGRTTAFKTPQQYTHGADVVAQFSTPAKWTKAVVVFGDNETAVARVVPGGDVHTFDIPEKAQVLAGE